MEHEIKSYQCRHIFADGHRCGSPSLRKEEFCYYHHTSRIPLNHTRSSTGSLGFDLLAPEDRNSIQRNIGEVLQRLASDKIQPKRAALLLYGLSIASANLGRTTPVQRDEAPVEEVVDDLSFGLIAPADDRPQHDPGDHIPLRRDTVSPSRRNTLELARAATDRTIDVEIRMAAAAALLEETEAEYKAACEPEVLQPKAPRPIRAFAQTPQYIVVDESHSPRYSEFTSGYPMATSG